MGKNGDYQLAGSMLSNVYLLPHILEEPMERVDMWHSCSDEDPEYIDYFPERIQEAITDEDLEWIRERYKSDSFKKVLMRHIEINHEFESASIGDARSKLVKEGFNLLDMFR